MLRIISQLTKYGTKKIPTGGVRKQSDFRKEKKRKKCNGENQLQAISGLHLEAGEPSQHVRSISLKQLETTFRIRSEIILQCDSFIVNWQIYR